MEDPFRRDDHELGPRDLTAIQAAVKEKKKADKSRERRKELKKQMFDSLENTVRLEPKQNSEPPF